MSIVTRERQWHALLYVVLAAGGLVVALPFLYALSTSFKTSFDALRIPIEWIPREWHFENYTLPFRQRPIARYFLNSVGVSSAVTLLNLVTCTMAGYSFAKFSYIGRDLLFSGVLASLMVPIQVIVVPLFILVKGLGWLDSYTGLIVPAGTSAFGVFLMRQYLLGVPRDFIEAARIDGARGSGPLPPHR
ncbi:MAG: carbohydrate ABC transporter permease, partial [Firmicutes bacterium]|nr:carbohydrate ABC transporter permease [Bacillota bacterium]